jgi:hypothetical protein
MYRAQRPKEAKRAKRAYMFCALGDECKMTDDCCIEARWFVTAAYGAKKMVPDPTGACYECFLLRDDCPTFGERGTDCTGFGEMEITKYVYEGFAE